MNKPKTLSDQLFQHTDHWDCYNDRPLIYDHTNKAVKIAEYFAIEFANWCRQECKVIDNKWYDNTGRKISTEELMLKFKRDVYPKILTTTQDEI